jgi:hypothetical protein
LFAPVYKTDGVALFAVSSQEFPYSLVGQDIRLSPGRPGFKSRWGNYLFGFISQFQFNRRTHHGSNSISNLESCRIGPIAGEGVLGLHVRRSLSQARTHTNTLRGSSKLYVLSSHPSTVPLATCSDLHPRTQRSCEGCRSEDVRRGVRGHHEAVL